MADGRRLHLADGPIDLVIVAEGRRDAVREAEGRAIARAATILDELCAELPLLRSASDGSVSAAGAVARRMQEAVAPLAATQFITPMAAVAGAVADAVLQAMIEDLQLDRAFVNNGGDIALHLTSGARFAVGMVARPDHPSLFGSIGIGAGDAVRGIATSGWRGRSHSLGIADAASVLASSAAEADAAATVIANAVDLPLHPAVGRVPAGELDPQSDLGALPVTVRVGHLTPADVATALDAGAKMAESLLHGGLIAGAALNLQGTTRLVGAYESQDITGEKS